MEKSTKHGWLFRSMVLLTVILSLLCSCSKRQDAFKSYKLKYKAGQPEKAIASGGSVADLFSKGGTASYSLLDQDKLRYYGMAVSTNDPKIYMAKADVQFDVTGSADTKNLLEGCNKEVILACDKGDKSCDVLKEIDSCKFNDSGMAAMKGQLDKVQGELNYQLPSVAEIAQGNASAVKMAVDIAYIPDTSDEYAMGQKAPELANIKQALPKVKFINHGKDVSQEIDNVIKYYGENKAKFQANN
jgi:hypothetical protein